MSSLLLTTLQLLLSLVVRPGPDWDPRQSRTPPKVVHPSLLELLILMWRMIISPRRHQVLRKKRASLANC